MDDRRAADGDDDDDGGITPPAAWRRCLVCLRLGEAGGGPDAARLLQCPACRIASYCGSDCQRADWKRHREACAYLRECRERQLRVVALMASHIEDERRLRFLCHCLKSVVDQALPASAFYVSWSCADHVSRARCAAVIDGVGVGIRGFRAFFRPGRASQFEHYASLRAHVAATADDARFWLLFSDDDDLWDQQRVFAYWGVLGNSALRGVLPQATSIRSLVYAAKVGTHVRTEMQLMSTEMHAFQPTCAVHVTGAIERGLVRTEEPASDTKGDYVNYCVRAAVFREFFEHVPADLVAHRLCDMAFVHFVRHYRPDDGFVTPSFAPSREWMYYYRDNGGYTHAATPVRVHADEQTVAARLRASSTGMPRDLSDDEMERLAAYVAVTVELAYICGWTADAAAERALSMAGLDAQKKKRQQRRWRKRRQIHDAVVRTMDVFYAELEQRWGRAWVDQPPPPSRPESVNS